jgi:hypothetical protein
VAAVAAAAQWFKYKERRKKNRTLKAAKSLSTGRPWHSSSLLARPNSDCSKEMYAGSQHATQGPWSRSGSGSASGCFRRGRWRRGSSHRRPAMLAVVRGACPELWHGARVLCEIKGSLCIYMSSCVAANYESSMKPLMQRSCQHSVYAWAAEFGESELHCATAMRVCLSSRHYIGPDRRPSSPGLARSPASILRTGHRQITAIGIRELPGLVQMQWVQATIAGPDHAATCVNATVPAPPGMHFGLDSIGDVHASSSTQCLLLIRAGRVCPPCHCAVSMLSERIVLFTSSTCTSIATVCSSAANSSAAVNSSVGVGLEHQLLLYPSSCCPVRPVSSGSGQSSWIGGDLSRSFGAGFGGEEEAWVAVERIACARSSPWRERDLGSRAQFIRAASWCVSDLKSQFG